MKVAIIGSGAMGESIALGVIEGCAEGGDAVDLTVSNPHESKLQRLSARGVRVTTDNVAAVAGADLVILCVKPWKVEEVIREIRDHVDPAAAEVAVVAASVTLSDIKEFFTSGRGPGECPAFSIVMPNTAVKLRQSMTFIVEESAGCSALAQGIFRLLGEVKIIEERLLPAATSLASCGIAYAMRYVRAAAEGGVELGFRAQEAQEIVAQTLLGAAAILQQPGAHAEAEIDRVTTPGGLTIRGLNAMEEAGFTSAVIRGLKASMM